MNEVAHGGLSYLEGEDQPLVRTVSPCTGHSTMPAAQVEIAPQGLQKENFRKALAFQNKVKIRSSKLRRKRNKEMVLYNFLNFERQLKSLRKPNSL